MMPRARRLGVRWTVGDVSAHGYDALRLSIWGARRLFGDRARYTVCVNSVPVGEARRRTGGVPRRVRWRAVGRRDIPGVVAARLDAAMAEGMGWKFAPVRLYADRHELALDNDCILWEMPAAMARWLELEDACLVAEDVRALFGQFSHLCGDGARNLGIRGTPPAFDLEGALGAVLERNPVTLASELDEQGLQVAALSLAGAPCVVSVDDVTICSPFWPHRPEPGRCGAHFVGLNARALPWEHDGRPAIETRHEHWLARRAEIAERVGAPRSPRVALR
ncbi:MAG: hypothetical protein ACJ79S_03775 [Gemmatimonadaceae bacterium]